MENTVIAASPLDIPVRGEKTKYTINTKHFREEIVAALDKATLRRLCEEHGIATATSHDRKWMVGKLSRHISSATVVIEWHT